MNRPEVIATGLGAGEGPVWCPDGTVVVTSVDQGVLYRVWPSQRHKEVLARGGGGPNGATPATDGGFVVAQNGGFDFRVLGVDLPPSERIEPGLQRVAPDGAVSTLVAGGVRAPNDLVADAEGTLYFTDPPRFPVDRTTRDGRVWAMAPGQAPKVPMNRALIRRAD